MTTGLKTNDILIDIAGLSIGFAGANGGAPIVRDFDLTIRRGAHEPFRASRS